MILAFVATSKNPPPHAPSRLFEGVTFLTRRGGTRPNMQSETKNKQLRILGVGQHFLFKKNVKKTKWRKPPKTFLVKTL